MLLITHRVSGKCYIGSSRNIEKRFADGWRPAATAKKLTSPLAQALAEYGLAAFVVELLFYALVTDGTCLEDAETVLIALHDCVMPNGYNVVGRLALARASLSDRR